MFPDEARDVEHDGLDEEEEDDPLVVLVVLYCTVLYCTWTKKKKMTHW